MGYNVNTATNISLEIQKELICTQLEKHIKKSAKQIAKGIIENFEISFVELLTPEGKQIQTRIKQKESTK